MQDHIESIGDSDIKYGTRINGSLDGPIQFADETNAVSAVNLKTSPRHNLIHQSYDEMFPPSSISSDPLEPKKTRHSHTKLPQIVPDTTEVKA